MKMTARIVGSGPLTMVDDSSDDIEIVRRCFSRSRVHETHRFLAFESGFKFLEYMEQVEAGQEPMPSIVLLDINMPRLNGFEVLQQLRAKPAFASVPAVAFVSNSDRSEDSAHAQGLGAVFAEKFTDIQEGIDFFNNMLD